MTTANRVYVEDRRLPEGARAAGQVLLCCGDNNAGAMLRSMRSMWQPFGYSCAWEKSGAHCRELAKQVHVVGVVVGPSVRDVAPVNLVAAICADARRVGGSRPWVILSDEVITGSLASRARCAGALGVMPTGALYEGMQGLFGTIRPQPNMQQTTDAATPAAIVRGDHAGVAHRAIAIGSGRGGVGKSTISMMLAIAAQKSGIDTLLIDLDVQFGDIAYLLGLTNPPTVLDALGIKAQEPGASRAQDGIRIKDRAMRVAGECDLLAAPKLPEYGDLLAGNVKKLIDLSRESYALTIVNLGSTWSDIHAEAFLACDSSLFVTDPRPASIAACKRAGELAGRLGIPQAKVGYVLNKRNPKGSITATDVSVALGGAHVHELPDGGWAVEELIGSGCPEQLFAQKNPLAQGAAQLMAKLAQSFGYELAQGHVKAEPPKHMQSRGRLFSRKKKGVLGT